MSANLHIDFGNTMLFVPSINTGLSIASGVGFGLSGATVGQWVDLSNSDTYCGVYATILGGVSGPIGIAIQTAPGPNDVPLGNSAFSGNIFSGGVPLSGRFTDPTSGLAQLPTTISSGGVWWLNSGLYTLPGGAGNSGTLVNGYPAFTIPFGPNPVQQAMGGIPFIQSGAWPEFASGGIAFANFQRNFQYARLVLLSGATSVGGLQAGFLSQLMTTGSGPGYTWAPLGNTGVLV